MAVSKKPGHHACHEQFGHRRLGEGAIDDHGDARRKQDSERAARRQRSGGQPRTYLRFCNSGNATRPIDAAVATLEPLMAAKIAQPAMLVCNSPPGIQDTSFDSP